MVIEILIVIYLFSYALSYMDIKFLVPLFLSNIIMFIVFYTFADNSFADDRRQYYNWFLDTKYTYDAHADIIFSYFFHCMSFFIESQVAFYSTLSLVFFISIFVIFYKYISLNNMIILFALILMNRLYLDYEMSIIRSTLASLFILFIYLRINVDRNIFYIFLLPFVFFTHKAIFLILIALYFTNKFISFRFSLYIFFIGIFVFLFDIILFNSILTDKELLSYIKVFYNNIYYLAENSNYNISWSIKIQFFIYIILPLIIIYFFRKSDSYNNELKFLFFLVGFALITYTTFPIIARVFAFAIPLIYFIFLQSFSLKSKQSQLYVGLVILMNTIVLYKNIIYLDF